MPANKGEPSYRRARRWIRNHLDPSRYTTLDKFINAVGSEMNFPYAQTDRERLFDLYKESHEGLVSSREIEHVTRTLPKASREDRLRRNDIWDFKYGKKRGFMEKGFYGERLKAKMRKLKVPPELAKPPVIPSMPPLVVEREKVRKFVNVRRYMLTTPRLVTRKDGSKARYYKMTVTQMPHRAYYFRRNGHMVTWRKLKQG